MTRFHRISFFGRLSVLLLCSAAASAQFQARLTGTVQDTTGAVLAGAKTQARNLATGVVQETLTNESGIYVFHSLAPGEYELRCEAAGFKAFLQGRLLLETGATRTLDVTMEIGAVSEVVEVTGQAPLLNSESATVGQFIERTTVLNMPFSSRRIGSLARLAGAVAYRREDGNLATPQFSMAGGRSENQMWLTDGAATQNAQLGSPQSVLNPPAEAMQEIKMETSNVGAEFGRAGGGLILMTTRSGTNQHHGAVYEFFRNDKLDARTFFAAEKAPFRFNIFGFSAGGPIVRNRTFFFANYEGDRRRSGTTLSGILVPHMPERTGNFSNRRDLVVRDPAANAPFPGNIIPASRFDRVGRIMATLYPEPNVPGSDITRAPSSNFFANVSDPLTKHFLTARVDHTLSAKDMLFVRAFRGSQPNETRPINPNTFADTRNNVIRPSQMQFLGNWTRNVSAGLFIETRFLFDRRRNNTASGGASSGKNREFGLREVNPDFFPLISVAGLSNLGRDGQRRAQTHNVRHFLHNLTWIKGSHQVKTGFELRYSRSKDDNDSLAGGQFAFADRATGSGLAELLLGRVNSAQFNDNDALDLRSDYWGLFIQDNWKVTSKLTLNLGLRWDLDTPRRERQNRQSGFDTTAINPVSGTPGVVTFSGRDGASRYANDFDKNNFGPRFGFAWRPRTSWVLRGGYALSYYGMYADAVVFSLFNGFARTGSFSSPDGGLTPAFQFSEGMPPIPPQELGPAFGAVRVGQAPRLSPDFFQRNHDTGYSQQWNFTVQKELPFQMALEAAYLANVGHKLGGQDVNINMIPLVNGRGPAVQSQTLRPFPQFNNVMHKYPPWGNSSYHALNVKLEKRYSSGLNLLTNYTWSKFLDNVQGNQDIGGGSAYTHIALRHLDKSYSGSDLRHRWVMSSIYDIPIGKGRRIPVANPVLNHVVGGWTLGAVIEARSGAPYNVVEQTNRTNTFSGAPRPNLLRDPTLDAGRPRGEKLDRYFDTGAFSQPGIGEFGDAARNVGFGPGLVDTDVSVNKRFPINERFQLVFRTDLLNLPNRPNFANPAAVRGRGDFGRIVAILPGSTGRNIQLNLRLEW